MSRFLPASLAARLVLTTVALVATVSIAVALAATLVMRGYLTDRLDTQLAESVQRAQGGLGGQFGDADRLRDDGAPIGVGPFDPCTQPPPVPRGQGAGSITAIITSQCRTGTQVTSSAQLRELSSSALTVLEDVAPSDQPTTVSLPNAGTFRVVAIAFSDGSTLIQGLPTAEVNDTINQFIWWEVLLSIAGAGVVAALGSVIVRRQLRPLRQVAATAQRVTTLDLETGRVGQTVRVSEQLTDSSTEVGHVGEALNQLLDHVERALDARHESEQQVRQFLADASHELRTPLATIRGYAELGRHTGTDQTAKVETEAQRMSHLVDDMLLLARLDSGRPIAHDEVDLSRLLAEAVADARVVGTDHVWRLELPSEPVTVFGDDLRLHQVVTNLLNNAQRHTPPGTTVTSSLIADDSRVRISVHDDGPGLTPELLAVVFDRFTRGDGARTRSVGGAGLGTSIVRAVAQAHGGTASATSQPGDTTFTIEISRGKGS